VTVLQTVGVRKMAHINVLEDEDVRRYAKEYRCGRPPARLVHTYTYRHAYTDTYIHAGSYRDCVCV
jgi:hypothetical protein